MSWTFDFGVVKSADQLRKRKLALKLPRDVSQADQRAALEHLEAARDAACLLLESPAFADLPVAIYASGQAQADHLPRDAEYDEVEVTLKGGEVTTQPSMTSPSAIESITLTLTQHPG